MGATQTRSKVLLGEQYFQNRYLGMIYGISTYPEQETGGAGM